ncbi:uncharacterized protein LTR77_006241 [Saxophila tyrrhenica]|uniref:Cytochrome P450 n=1 Tax=Saxophila tyrrhenica TaxID=1690608 RepID=A0AAV9PB90_9PEZI|nr:hypothetical protein LTR77_006241 [Saxophila tyrrhenica]
MVYRGLCGPLSHIPGPLVSRFTRLRLKVAVLQGERVRYIHRLHEQYGPIVRVSTEEISLADIKAAKIVYKVGGLYLKSDFYDAFTGRQPVGNAFSMVDFHEHSRHRRLTSANFTEKWISNMEPFIADITRSATARMADEASRHGFTDVFKWFTFMATDVIGESSFGTSFRMVERGQKDQYIRDLENVTGSGVIRSEFSLFFRIMKQIPVGPAKEIANIIKRLQSYGRESIERYYTSLNADPEHVKPTLLTKEFALVDAGEMSLEQIQRDAVGNIIAGTDTTALTATNAVWLLSQHPDIEQKLIRQVSELPSDFKNDDLQKVSLLQSIVNETLRLRGTISQGLPRTVPPGGAEFCGYFVPGGSVCGIQSHTMHRDPSIWPHPEVFDPSRWDEPTKDQLHAFLPFGGGSRVCLGMHFAQLELRHALANFYRAFPYGVRASQAEGFTEADMTPMAFFIDGPRGKRCLMESRKAMTS